MSAKGKSKHSNAQPSQPGKPSKSKGFTSNHRAIINLGRPLIVIALAVLLLVIGVLWAGPGINIDLMASLAGGRDVVAGHLGQPDNWSFLTGSRVWLDQNWGSGLIFYLCQRALGYNGLLWLKAILLMACALFGLLAARRRQVPWPIALLSTAFILFAIRNYVYLRANIMTLVFAPLELWLLYRSLERPARIWLVAGLMVLWANLHGGFIFGLGVMALWTTCLLIATAMAEGMKTFNRYWQLIAATVTAVLLAGFINPFGMANLTHPFLILGEKYWRNVAEWKPLLGGNFSLTNTWEFFVIIFGIIILSLRRIMKTPRNKPVGAQVAASMAKGEPSPKTTGRTLEPVRAQNGGVIMFEVILAVLLVFMAFTSLRFIPLALILLIPVLAMQLGWFVGRRRWPQWTVVIMGLLIVILVWGQMNRSLRYYRPNNPLSSPEPFFDKMNLAYHFFPSSLTQFVNDNQIKGNVFSNWEWEGYLHWQCPQLKLFVGSRAQQVYQVSEYKLYNEIINSQSPAEELKRLKIHMVACSYSGVFTDLINRLVTGGQWVVIFNDNYNCLLVDTAWEASRSLREGILQDRLAFPNQAESLLSRASYLLSPGVDEKRSKAIGLIKQAVELRPMSKGYQALVNFVLPESDQTQEVVAFLEGEAGRLGKMGVNTPDSQEILMSRYWISMILNQYYTNAKMTEQAQQTQLDLQALQQVITALHEVWDYQRQ